MGKRYVYDFRGPSGSESCAHHHVDYDVHFTEMKRVIDDSRSAVQGGVDPEQIDPARLEQLGRALFVVYGRETTNERLPNLTADQLLSRTTQNDSESDVVSALRKKGYTEDYLRRLRTEELREMCMTRVARYMLGIWAANGDDTDSH